MILDIVAMVCWKYLQQIDNETILQFHDGTVIIQKADLQHIYSPGRMGF